jgi:hypothetical protein
VEPQLAVHLPLVRLCPQQVVLGQEVRKAQVLVVMSTTQVGLVTVVVVV